MDIYFEEHMDNQTKFQPNCKMPKPGKPPLPAIKRCQVVLMDILEQKEKEQEQQNPNTADKSEQKLICKENHKNVKNDTKPNNP